MYISKKIKAYILLIFFLIIGSFINLEARTVIQYNLGQGGKLDWNGKVGKGCRCKKGGDDCYITIIQTSSDVVNPKTPPSQYTLVSNISRINADITLSEGGSFNQDIETNLFEFPDGASVTIITCDEFPIVNGKIIDLTNQITNEYGQLIIDFSI